MEMFLFARSSKEMIKGSFVLATHKKGDGRDFDYPMEFYFNKFPSRLSPSKLSHIETRYESSRAESSVIVEGEDEEKLITFKSDKILYENVKGLTRKGLSELQARYLLGNNLI